jgi:hypothetical protein
MGGDRILQFEEDNFDWLLDKFFLNNKAIKEEWDNFVYEEYEKSLQEPEEDR